jgi:hypothetical protein
MRSLLLVLCWAFPAIANAGAIFDQYSGGFGGIAWGTSLTNLIAAIPGGDQYFSTASGHRLYSVRSDEFLLAVPRAGMRTQYHLSANGTVELIGISVPFDRRDQLLGALISAFGTYRGKMIKGVSDEYSWPADPGIKIAVRASRDPTNGILEFWIVGPRYQTPAHCAAGEPANNRLERP